MLASGTDREWFGCQLLSPSLTLWAPIRSVPTFFIVCVFCLVNLMISCAINRQYKSGQESKVKMSSMRKLSERGTLCYMLPKCYREKNANGQPLCFGANGGNNGRGKAMLTNMKASPETKARILEGMRQAMGEISGRVRVAWLIDELKIPEQEVIAAIFALDRERRVELTVGHRRLMILELDRGKRDS